MFVAFEKGMLDKRKSKILFSYDMQAASVRVHQDFAADVLRGGRPYITKHAAHELEGKDLSLEEFKHWTALVSYCCCLSLFRRSLQPSCAGSILGLPR